MPVEISLPLTKLEQAVADARQNESRCAAIVEDLKLQLKTAKAAWEEAVEELKSAVDEMIRDKRQPSLFSDRDADEDAGTTSGGNPGPNPPAPAGNPVAEPASEAASVTTVEIIRKPAPAYPSASAADALDRDLGLAPLPSLAAGPAWRALAVTEHLDAEPGLFDALDKAGVVTLGELADALQRGARFGLPLVQVYDLQEVIEDVSQADENPIRFDGEAGEGEGEADTSGVLFAVGDPTVEPPDEPAPEPEPEPEPAPAAKQTRRGRGKKKLTDADLAGL